MMRKVRKGYKDSCSGFGKGKPCQSPIHQLIGKGYVELTGVVNPRSIKEIRHEPPQTKSDTKQDVGPVVYEYSWAVGMTGSDMRWYAELDKNDPIVIQLIFHTKHSRYAIHEVAANLKQVPPFKKTRSQEIRDWLEMFSPLVATTGKVMELAGATIPGKIISAISQMKLNSVPVDEFPWYVKTFSWEENAGIEWHIPQSLIEYTGNRLVGSLGAYFVGCEVADSESQDELSLELRAFLRSGGEELFISPTDEPTQLVITPDGVEPKKETETPPCHDWEQ